MAPGGRATGNLPTELTSFVGRRDELAEVRRLLAGSHLLTLTGVGGVGKTRLALRAAAGLARAFPDGVWLVRLDQLREQALVAQAVPGALGLQDRAGCSPAAWLAEYLAGRRLLLVLDNCEHIAFSAGVSHSEMRSSFSDWPVTCAHIRERFLSIDCRVATSWPTRMAPLMAELADGFPATKYLPSGTSMKMTLT
jgi:hypothetical protein